MFNWDEATKFDLEMKMLMDSVDSTWSKDEVEDLKKFLHDYCSVDGHMDIINKI